METPQVWCLPALLCCGVASVGSWTIQHWPFLICLNLYPRYSRWDCILCRSWFNILLLRVTSFLFVLRIAPLYLFVFLPHIPAPGSFGRSRAILLSFSNIVMPSNWWACPNPNNSPHCCRTMGLNLSQELRWCVPARRRRSGSRMDATPTPGEKMSGITAFSTQLTPETDGASEHCGAAPAETMATACTQQQEDCQANRRGEHI